MEWKNIQINIQNIETDTGKATLIKMPNKSKYAEYKFWYPSKLIRNGKHSYAKSLGYTNDFKFKLKKFGNGKYNQFDVIDEIEISVEEFEEAFGIMNDNIEAPIIKNKYETHKPLEKEAIKSSINEDLLDD